MRTFILFAAIASAAWTMTGCDSSAPAPGTSSTDPAARESSLPGVPTEGAEAPKTKAKR